MKTASLLENLEYNNQKIVTKVILETQNTKEIRILLKKGQILKEHQAPFTIIVEVFEGNIDFRVNQEIFDLKRGSLITLEGKIPHSLEAKEDSIVRLSFSKGDL
ncbi:AraC-like regulator [Bernardetia litoralis DSM 6794]|uniref:AraC-like regulator n=1 Tax=Bernardetia litoralis (strain ATCC 23117 / DSM 6794 / NBRC 15988 / NCIMB 1366 / Fx l1 / Sio-4) TaxID=880071 RepID=I4AGK5_BERLS|nr:cupin domain-containing protein [Bernardetia litoralis]AFM03090.1 AraC-like regulator [Bernardetia litoralis DSM 6794]